MTLEVLAHIGTDRDDMQATLADVGERSGDEPRGEASPFEPRLDLRMDERECVRQAPVPDQPGKLSIDEELVAKFLRVVADAHVVSHVPTPQTTERGTASTAAHGRSGRSGRSSRSSTSRIAGAAVGRIEPHDRGELGSELGVGALEAAERVEPVEERRVRLQERPDQQTVQVRRRPREQERGTQRLAATAPAGRDERRQ